MDTSKVKQSLNTLTLKHHKHWPELDTECFEVFIDGKPLSQLIKHFEQQCGCELEGDYRPSLLSRDILVKAIKTSENRSETLSPLICECGDLDCCFVECRVNVSDKLVHWSHWQFDYRDPALRDDDFNADEYKNFPSLVFEKQAYMAEINKVQQVLALLKDKS